MYNYQLHRQIQTTAASHSLNVKDEDDIFYARFLANASVIHQLFIELYSGHQKWETGFQQLLDVICLAYSNRSQKLRQKDMDKLEKGTWFVNNELAGMSLYVDRFCGDLKSLGEKLDYFKKLGVNVLHLMPLFESPEGESDGGYAVSDFRKINSRFGTLTDLETLQKKMSEEDMYLMIDIVFNHTSHQHEWAIKAKQGDKSYQDFFYLYDNRAAPNEFEKWMPEVFPESAPGNFTYVEECKKWVMTVFHNYQWDLNYTNPAVFVAMLDTVFFYANIGVDILRIDAPAFIWKQIGTSCQNLPQAHTILQLLKHCVQVTSPGMALIGEAIVGPRQIMDYFGTRAYRGKE
jgi:amylosucrase